MYLGIDIGTSAVKAVVVDDNGSVVDQASSALEVSRPQPLWSEQNPADWWSAANNAVSGLGLSARAAVRAIGLTGQMHGATLLNQQRRALRPAILWNDGRSAEQCAELEAAVPEMTKITGNRAMPGFTAPKLLWVRRHEPKIFAETALVLLPKDYVRLRMTGEAASDMSDSAGTLWLDVAQRRWSPAMLVGHRLESNRTCLRSRKATKSPASCARKLPKPGAWRACRWSPAAATTPPVRSVSGWYARAMPSCRWAPPACCFSPMMTIGRTPRPASTPSAMRCRDAGTRCRSY